MRHGERFADDGSRGRAVARGMLRAGRRLAVALVILVAAWTAGLVWFAERIPRVDGAAIPDTATDAVVVLTGGPLRLQTGLAVLEAGQARKLLVSGVHPSVEMTELLRSAQRPVDGRECCIVLGYDADNTAGNATETRAWMRREGYRSLRLVTASYHMQRSLLEFRRALPGVTIVPHPVFPEGFKREDWWTWPGTFALIVSEYHKYLAALARSVFIESSTAS